jgi:hypothetical protein
MEDGIDRQAVLSWRLLFYEIADPPNHLACPHAILDDAAQRLTYLIQPRRSVVQPVQGCLCAGNYRGGWLTDFVGDRCRELPHHRNTVRVRQLHLCLAVAPLALVCLGFRALALAQVQHESNRLVSLLIECGCADQYRSAGAVFAKVLLLDEEQEVVSVKGFAQPVRAYRVVGIYDELEKDGQIIREERDGFRLLVDLTKGDQAGAIAAVENVLARLKG